MTMANVSTNSTPLPIGTGVFRIPLHGHGKGDTYFQQEHRVDNLAMAPQVPETLKGFQEAGVPLLNTTHRIVEAAQVPIARPAQGGANGVVMALDDASVRCEFLHGNPAQIVWLPRSLFPQDVDPGFPFVFVMDQEDGRSTPKILPRQPAPTPELDAKVTDLLARLTK